MGREKNDRYKLQAPRRVKGNDQGKHQQIKKGIGACIFTLGIPLVISGLILTIVTGTSNNGDHPGTFEVLGPLLICMSVICFIVGSILSEMIDIQPCLTWICTDDTKSHCWKKCPFLFSILRPNDVTLLQRRAAGLSALQTLPSRPALKKTTEVHKEITNKRGVHFSDGKGDVRISVSSDQSDQSPSSSLLSLRHCKIHPEDQWATTIHETPVFKTDVSENMVAYTLPGISESKAQSENVTLQSHSDETCCNQSKCLTDDALYEQDTVFVRQTSSLTSERSSEDGDSSVTIINPGCCAHVTVDQADENFRVLAKINESDTVETVISKC